MIVTLLACAVLESASWHGTVTVSPADGAEHVPVRQTVSVTFSSAPPEGTRVWLDGGAVYAEGWPSPTEWTGTPTEDLARDATHHVLVDVGGERVVTAFHTAGPAVEGDLVGRTYEMNLEDTSNLTWLLPSGGWGPLLSQSLGSTHSVLLMVTGDDGDTLRILGAAGTTEGGEVTQSPDIPTWWFDDAHFADDPVLAIGAPEVGLSVGGLQYSLFDLAAIGELTADGTSIRELHVTTLLDARPIEASRSVDVCTNVPCAACPDQGAEDAPGCVPLEFELDETPWIEGLALCGAC